jgi:beta-glucosidase
MDSSSDRPVKVLKGFQKIFLKAGETKMVKIPLSFDDFAFWNEQTHQWQVDHGEYLVQVGNSSADIKEKIKIKY